MIQGSQRTSIATGEHSRGTGARAFSGSASSLPFRSSMQHFSSVSCPPRERPALAPQALSHKASARLGLVGLIGSPFGSNARTLEHVRSRATSAGSNVLTQSLSTSSVTGFSEPASTPSPAAPSSQKDAVTEAGAEEQPQPYVLVTGAYVLPHPDKMAKGGEDWFYISDTMRSMGVADGVGGWAEIGVDAGLYARQLMGAAKELADQVTADGNSEFKDLCTNLAQSDGSTASTITLQQTILEKAYAKTDVRGSSTACLLVLAGSRILASNLGDSGFLVIRKGEVVFHSPQQQHDFNFPFQIGSADSMSDPPTSSQRFELVTQPGDVLVMGTDGLWDNCFDEEIMSVIRYCQDVNMPMDKTAQVLAHYARHRAADPKFASPFAYAAFQAGFAYMGGKMDDITVVVARVAHASEVAGNPLPGQGGLDLTMPQQSSKL